MAKEEKQAWFSKLAGEFQKSHLVSNVFIGLTLTALEKIIDVEYVCPCDPDLNGYAYAFFVVPSVLAFVLMMNIQRCRSLKDIFFSCVPVIEWLILVFTEGNYFVCARTTWYGEYVSIPEPASLKWCEPVNKNSSRQLLIQSQQCFYESQVRKIMSLENRHWSANKTKRQCWYGCV